jgi:thioredoxin-dependent peroxiredoxin
MLKVGDKAPDFSLTADDGKIYGLKRMRGKRVVLYFYPKDNTPGCTIEGCAFRDNMPGFKERNAIVLGVSKDSEDSHRHFSQMYHFNFPLLTDTDMVVCKAYGVWVEKNFLGKKYMGISRATFIIDENGQIAAIFPNVNPLGHANTILNTLSMMKSEPIAKKSAKVGKSNKKSKKGKK